MTLIDAPTRHVADISGIEAVPSQRDYELAISGAFAYLWAAQGSVSAGRMSSELLSWGHGSGHGLLVRLGREPLADV